MIVSPILVLGALCVTLSGLCDIASGFSSVLPR
jgi:hypothetical protein